MNSEGKVLAITNLVVALKLCRACLFLDGERYPDVLSQMHEAANKADAALAELERFSNE